MTRIALIACCLALAACAGSGARDFAEGDTLYSPFANMSRGQCGNADWREKGRIEGARGAPREIIRSYYDFCAKHGEAPDEALFYRGYDEGVAQRGG
ncbi:MAG: hypothetical protein AAFU61_01905 [Pseudomonadota bacterium]